MLSTFRFFKEFLRSDPAAVVAEETTYERDGEALPATMYQPAGAGDSPLPGWIILHGLTRTGREHPSLVRFSRAVAASGAVVLVPELPEWRALQVAPGTTVATIKATVLQLDAHESTAAGRVGVIGFSFGATQALIAATDPALEGHLAGVAAWGGYAEILRATMFAFLGTHELDGVEHHLDPDPYGRWILAGNYLHLLPDHADGSGVAAALLELAREAGLRGIKSWSPETDALKAEARAALEPSEREIFDLIAPPTSRPYTDQDSGRLRDLVRQMTDRAVEHEPQLDPGPYLARVAVPVFLAHGRGDRLMPWTEVVRLRRALPADRVVYCRVTSLFAHSFGERRFPTPAVILEAIRFIRMIGRMLRLI